MQGKIYGVDAGKLNDSFFNLTERPRSSQVRIGVILFKTKPNG